MSDVLGFITNEILAMKWLDRLIGALLEFLFGLEFSGGKWGLSLQFFIYDFIKIGILLCVLIFIVSYIQSFFPPERTKKILGKFKGIRANNRSVHSVLFLFIYSYIYIYKRWVI